MAQNYNASVYTKRTKYTAKIILDMRKKGRSFTLHLCKQFESEYAERQSKIYDRRAQFRK